MFPIGDWQFWAVTMGFVAAMLWLCRGLLPWSTRRRRNRGHRATLTIEGESVRK